MQFIQTLNAWFLATFNGFFALCRYAIENTPAAVVAVLHFFAAAAGVVIALATLAIIAAMAWFLVQQTVTWLFGFCRFVLSFVLVPTESQLALEYKKYGDGLVELSKSLLRDQSGQALYSALTGAFHATHENYNSLLKTRAGRRRLNRLLHELRKDSKVRVELYHSGRRVDQSIVRQFERALAYEGHTVETI